jgi:hypothetical protein
MTAKTRKKIKTVETIEHTSAARHHILIKTIFFEAQITTQNGSIFAIIAIMLLGGAIALAGMR